MTRNRFGKGIGWYTGTIVNSDEFYDKLMTRVIGDAGIRPIVAPPAGVEVATRTSADGGLLFLLNHTDQGQTVAVPAGRQRLLGDTLTTETERLEPFGVSVIKLSAADIRPASKTVKPKEKNPRPVNEA